jgi:hypothetical protein
MSVRYGVDAVVFDSSPRIFDGLGDKHLPATRILIYEGGEILTVARKLWKKKFNKAASRENIYKASFDFGGENKHRPDHLALGLLKLRATVDATLEPVRDELPKQANEWKCQQDMHRTSKPGESLKSVYSKMDNHTQPN